MALFLVVIISSYFLGVSLSYDFAVENTGKEIMEKALEIAKKNSQMVGRREIGFIDLEQLSKLIKNL